MFRLIISALIGAIIGGAMVSGFNHYSENIRLSEPPPSEHRAHHTTSKGHGSHAPAVARAAASVVSIYTNKISSDGQQGLRGLHPPFFPPTQPREQVDTNLGSGVVVSPDGHILTNLHILDKAEEIKVVLADGSRVKVGFIGKDEATDLAVLKMQTGQTPAIPIGRSDQLQVGDITLAIGNPFGVGQTVTMGIVSALGRSHLGISDYENFIQTDAAINPGNSGGALINTRGELIGINTAIYSASGGSHGIGFAVPVNLAISSLDQILQRGHVKRGWIGITALQVTPKLKASFGLAGETGVMVSGVLPDGPAETHDLRPGDVITHADNRELKSIQDLMSFIANAGPGRTLTLSGQRGSQSKEWPVVTSERPKAETR